MSKVSGLLRFDFGFVVMISHHLSLSFFFVVFCSTPSRSLQFNYHWMAQRINYTKYDSSYVRSGDVINIRNVKDNSFLGALLVMSFILSVRDEQLIKKSMKIHTITNFLSFNII